MAFTSLYSSYSSTYWDCRRIEITSMHHHHMCSLEFYYLKHPEAKMFKSFAYKADFTQLSSRRQWITYHPSTDQKVLTHFWFSSEICSHKIRRKKPYALMGFTFPPVGITKTNKKKECFTMRPISVRLYCS